MSINRLGCALPILTLFFLYSSCEAPRDNPLDPAGSNYVGPSKGAISGIVTNLANSPVVGAFVLSIPEYRGAVTNDSGYYSIEEVTAGSYQVVCAPTGYGADTLEILVSAGLGSTANFRLDTFPIIQSFQVTSRLIYQGPLNSPPYYYMVFARSRVTDPDGFSDIDSVILHFSGLDDKPMSFNPDSSIGQNPFYSITLTEDFFPSPFPDSIRLENFTCSARDTSGNLTFSTTEEIFNVFETWPYPFAPISNDYRDTPYPNLVWIPYSDLFANSIQVSVYREVTTENWQLEWQKTNITPTETSTVVDDSLPANTGLLGYKWFLEVFDMYGNSTRSEEAHFKIFY